MKKCIVRKQKQLTKTKNQRNYGILCTCGRRKIKKRDNILSGTHRRSLVVVVVVVAEKVMHAGVFLGCNVCVCVVCLHMHQVWMPALSLVSLLSKTVCVCVRVSAPPLSHRVKR